MKSIFAVIGILALAYFALGSPQIRQSIGNLFNQPAYDQSAQSPDQGYAPQGYDQSQPPAVQPQIQPPVDQYAYNQVQPVQSFQPVQPYLQPQQVWVQPTYQQVWRGGAYQRVLVRAGYYQPRAFAQPVHRHHSHFSFDFSAIFQALQSYGGGCR